jgi:hypothetical protein
MLLSITNGSAGKRSQFVDRRPHGNYALKFIFHSKALPDGMDEFAAKWNAQELRIRYVSGPRKQKIPLFQCFPRTPQPSELPIFEFEQQSAEYRDGRLSEGDNFRIARDSGTILRSALPSYQEGYFHVQPPIRSSGAITVAPPRSSRAARKNRFPQCRREISGSDPAWQKSSVYGRATVGLPSHLDGCINSLDTV